MMKIFIVFQMKFYNLTHGLVTLLEKQVKVCSRLSGR